jgi:hypothetical protein
MSWSDAYSGLPPKLQVTLAVLAAVTIVLAIAIVSYLALVVAPTVPAIVEAIKQGRSATLGPLGIGEYDPPSVKECKLVIEDSNNSLNSLRGDFEKSVDLLKSQQSILQDAINRRSEFMQLPEDKIKAMNYSSDPIWSQLNSNVKDAGDTANYIVNKLQGRVETAIDYLTRIKDYCHNPRSTVGGTPK